MTAVEIIEEIKRLPMEERNKVIEFAQAAGKDRQLSPEELGKLAKRMVETTDPTEADRLREEVVRGFYGGQSVRVSDKEIETRSAVTASNDKTAVRQT